jgi:hypothetical protein
MSNTPHRTTDYQKSRCYKWEDRHVAPLDQSKVPFSNIQAVVDHIWADLGYQYPPKVRPMPKQKAAQGDATRLTVRFPEDRSTPTWVIIHELAHSLTSTIDEGSALHGPDFVGVYMYLLDRFIPGANLVMLMTTAKMMKVNFNIMAKPAIVD